MVCGLMWGVKKKNDRREPDDEGEYWRCTLIEVDTRLRVGRGIGQNETEAALQLWQRVKQVTGMTTPPPLVSDGWGGHREALVEVFGQVPVYSGHGRPPTLKQAQDDWLYLQMVKKRENGQVIDTEARLIYGTPEQAEADLEHHTAYVERTHLTSRHMTGRLVRKTLGFSKRVEMLRAASVWEDVVYNLARSVKTLRVEVNDGQRRWISRSPAMAAGLTDRIWTMKDLLWGVPSITNRL
jgi:hypothetical protein